ncbi:MAG: MaoC family dehydratase [Janthinobacterium lividum]
MSAPPVGARLTKEIRFDAEAIRTTALHVGDTNPLHHDADIAAASRFGELIASGAYTSGRLAGLLSEGFGDEAADGKGQVGVDYTVRFIAPVRVDRLMRLEWTVAELEPRRSGTIARLEGSIVDTTTDTVAVAAEMKLFYFG